MSSDNLFNRVNGLDISDRLDSEYYTRELLENEHKINQFSQITLENMVDPEIPNNISDLTSNGSFEFLRGIRFSEESGIPFIRTQNLLDGYVSDEGMLFVEAQCASMVRKSLCNTGDLIVCRKGKVGSASSVHEDLSGSAISENITRFSLKNDADADFVSVFLNSEHGRKRFLREATGVIQKWINNEKLRKISVLQASPKVEKYIGDKVRQAERLRAWAKDVELGIQDYHQNLIPDQSSLNFTRINRRVDIDRMTDRLDAHFYPAVVDDYLKNKQIDFQQLSKLCSGLTNGQTQKEATSGVTSEQITVANLSSNFVKGEPRQVVAPSKKDKFTQPHDLLMCNAAHNKSYIGRELTYCHSDKPLLPSTEVMIIRANREKVPASYIRTYLLTKLGYIQLQSTIRGITAHSYPVDVEKLDIPIPKLAPNQRENWFDCDNQMLQAGRAIEFSTLLTKSAKHLVEALIEGQLTEQQLIQAESSETANRALLERLKTDGFDGEGEPLFPDIDQLEQLLEEAADQ